MLITLDRPVSTRISGTLHLKKRPPQPTAGAHAEVDLTADAVDGQGALPHERDEKVGMTGGITSPQVQQAARDLKRGIKDTSNSVETDLAYTKLKRS